MLPTTILSVSELNHAAKDQLESRFGWICVRGEVSNLTLAQSGHLYFSIKDKDAQCRCVYFKKGRGPAVSLTHGQQILVSGRVSLYTPRGDFQLIASSIQDDGEGALALAFERNKKELEKEGLFDPARKKTLPSLPKHIGVITSPTGAALQDILSVLKQRFPSVPVRIYPCLVQGKTAAPSIIQALRSAEHEAICDLFIIARGGGSLEDLWPFNEKEVAYAVSHATTPIISGVGHETDTTLCDLVADKRAATPSNAAEIAVPDHTSWISHLQSQYRRLALTCLQKIKHLQHELLIKKQKIKPPQQRIQEQQQRLDQAQMRLQHLMHTLLNKLKHQLSLCQTTLAEKNPNHVLKQGYAMVLQADGTPISSISSITEKQELSIQLSDGTISVIVNSRIPLKES